MKNALLEAAAEILKGSLSSAHKDPMPKVDGEVQDLGGDTPQSHSDEALDPHATQATPPGKQPGSDTKAPAQKLPGSDAKPLDPTEPKEAAADQEERKRRIEAGLSKGDLKEEHDDEAEDKKLISKMLKDKDDDKDDDDKDDDDDKKFDFKKKLKEDVAAILASESGLPKEFATKIGTIYEARVIDKVATIQEEIEAEYAQKFEAAVLEVRESLSEQVNDYLDYVVEEWMKQNELAIEKGLRSELTEEFIGSLRNVFLEHYIDIPAEKVDLVDELATKVEELTSSLNEEVAKAVELKKQLGESKKSEILNTVCEGLTQTQVEKVRTLAESVEFTAEGDYTSKVSTIRENYFPVTSGKKANDSNAKMLTEVTEVADEKAIVADAGVASVVAVLTQQMK